ncbi:nucleotidyltransferase family protein [Patescibacteria group bacterium]|nr:nucleotidyltransferase family protein [Patescibacteria group bacterium]
MDIRIIKMKIRPVLKKAGVKKAQLFGSFARGEEKRNSDIDILVEMKPSSTLFDMVELNEQLEKKLNKKVDLLTFRAVHPRLKKYIESDAVDLL